MTYTDNASNTQGANSSAAAAGGGGNVTTWMEGNPLMIYGTPIRQWISLLHIGRQDPFRIFRSIVADHHAVLRSKLQIMRRPCMANELVSIL